MRRWLMLWLAKRLGYREFTWHGNPAQTVWCKTASEALSMKFWGNSVFMELPKWLRCLGGV